MLQIGTLELEQPLILSPMAALTDAVFRGLIDEIGGVGAMVTEMVSAESLRRRHPRTMEMVKPGVSSPKAPQFVQLFGADAEAMAEAARIVEEFAYAGIDLNMGCPAIKVVRTGAGAALLKDVPQLAAIVRRVRRATRRPLSVKIRLGYHAVNVLESSQAVAAEGADALTVHFRLQNDGYGRKARWDLASEIKSRLRIPLIGNGDIQTAVDARERLRLVDGVMIGRGAMANPFIFREISGRPTVGGDHGWLIRRLLERLELHYPERMRLRRLKGLLRFFNAGQMLTRSLKKPVFLTQDYDLAKAYLLELAARIEAVGTI